MPEFTYIVGAENGSFIIEADDPADLMYKAVDKLLEMLQENGLEIVPEEQPYLESLFAIAITRYLPSGRVISLGNLPVQPNSPRPQDELPLDAGNTYTLINVLIRAHIRRSYSPEQRVGAIIADIRKVYSLGLNDHIVIAQVNDGVRRYLKPATLVKHLSSRELHWEAKPYK